MTTDPNTEDRTGGSGAALPPVVDRAAFQAEVDRLRVREKAHTHEGDALAAARRRLPAVEVDAHLPLTGPDGPLTLLDAFEGRRQLIAYFHMWFDGHPAAEQCMGCTFFNSQVRELSHLHARDATYATFCQGPYAVSVRYRDFMGWDVPWYSVQDSADRLLDGREFAAGPLVYYLRDGDRVFETYWTGGRGLEVMSVSYGLLDRSVYGRQEVWEDSPAGWPRIDPDATAWRTDERGRAVPYDQGRPIAQWSRREAGRSDDLGPTS
jgi:predicted dithiol-disulfide oxidoreductase (DUF899 family)